MNRPVWRRIKNEIIILAEQEYRFNWRDADLATALFLSLMAKYERERE